MKLSTKTALVVCLALIAVAFTACDMMHEDRDDCPTGLYVMFKYDYNLQRADMFNDHVGSVTLYIFDEQGRFVKTQEESNTASAKPLKDRSYRMHVTGLPKGKYQFIALAGQDSYDEQLSTNRAKFVRKDIAAGSKMTDLEVLLDHVQATAAEAAKYGAGKYVVQNNALPLDTLWHGIDTRLIEVTDTRPTYDTISLVRDTKVITISLRELDDPTEMDINNYELTIEDRNAHILYDNSLDETDRLVYTPYATRNTEDDGDALDPNGNKLEGVGKIGHAYFMTSRIMYRKTAFDAQGNPNFMYLSIKDKRTGDVVVRANVADLLTRQTTYDNVMFTKQGFLDRGYDYQLQFYLNKGKFAYTWINVSVLSWAVRTQEELLR